MKELGNMKKPFSSLSTASAKNTLFPSSLNTDLRPPGRGNPMSGVGGSNCNFHTFHYIKIDQCAESPLV